MTDTATIEEQLAEAQAEATRLREHNATLLAEKKQLQADHTKLKDQYGKAAASLQRYQLDVPVEALVNDIAGDSKLFNAMFAEYHKFALDEDGRPQVQTLDGNPVLVQDKEGKEAPLPFEGNAIASYLCPSDKALQNDDTERWARILKGNDASGGSATGGSGKSRTATPQPAPAPAPPPVQYGLR